MFFQLSAINDRMADLAPSGTATLHTIKRHREILMVKYFTSIKVEPQFLQFLQFFFSIFQFFIHQFEFCWKYTLIIVFIYTLHC